MMHPTRILLTAAFSLLSVLSAQAANIKISALPFTITAPGTYVVTGNLSMNNGGPGDSAIRITNVTGGAVVLDLKGYTLNGAASQGFGVRVDGISVPIPITIRNGVIEDFYINLYAERTSYITVNNILFDASSVCVNFVSVNSSSVNNCTFQNTYGYDAASGIWDDFSNGGNSYNNDSFIGMSGTLATSNVRGNGVTMLLDHCQFAPPPSD
jgi:hypothetical protein